MKLSMNSNSWSSWLWKDYSPGEWDHALAQSYRTSKTKSHIIQMDPWVAILRVFVCMLVWVCVYVYVYSYTHMHMHTYIYTQAHTLGASLESEADPGLMNLRMNFHSWSSWLWQAFSPCEWEHPLIQPCIISQTLSHIPLRPDSGKHFDLLSKSMHGHSTA